MEGGMIRWGCITRGRRASCYSMHGEGEFCSVMNSVGIMYIGFVFQCVLYCSIKRRGKVLYVRVVSPTFLIVQLFTYNKSCVRNALLQRIPKDDIMLVNQPVEPIYTYSACESNPARKMIQTSTSRFNTETILIATRSDPAQTSRCKCTLL